MLPIFVMKSSIILIKIELLNNKQVRAQFNTGFAFVSYNLKALISNNLIKHTSAKNKNQKTLFWRQFVMNKFFRLNQSASIISWIYSHQMETSLRSLKSPTSSLSWWGRRAARTLDLDAAEDMVDTAVDMAGPTVDTAADTADPTEEAVTEAATATPTPAAPAMEAASEAAAPATLMPAAAGQY